MTDKVRAFIETLDRVGCCSLKIGVSVDIGAITEDHPGTRMVRFELRPHSFKCGDILFKKAHAPTAVSDLNWSK